jgi:hypothetical protein
MKLFMIEVSVIALGSEHTSIAGFLVAETHTDVMFHIDQYFNDRKWQSDDQKYPVYEDDDSDEQIGVETRIDRVMRLQGDINDPDRFDVKETYHAIVLYGWKVIAENFRVDPSMLLAILEGIMSAKKLAVIKSKNFHFGNRQN